MARWAVRIGLMGRMWRVVMALAVAFGTASVAAPTVLADNGNQLYESSSTTYRLDPARRVVEVRIDLSVTNHIPSATHTIPCPYDRSLNCRQTTTYYIENYGDIWIEDAAHNVHFSGPGGVSGHQVKNLPGFNGYELSFGRINNGQTQHATVTYELPAGGPRQPNNVRIGAAYAHFCMQGQGTDVGTITGILPKGYKPEVTGDPTRTTTRSGSVQVTNVHKTDPIEFTACIDAVDVDKLISTDVVGPDGRDLTIQAWPEDPEWSTSVTASVDAALPALESLIGQPLPGNAAVIVREVASQTEGGYAGDYSSERGTIHVAENWDDPRVISHEIAHAWFNDLTLTPAWLFEGHAEWAARTVTADPCRDPGTYPGKGKVNIGNWLFLPGHPTDLRKSQVDYQYEAACFVMSQVYGAVGPDRAKEALAAILAGESAYQLPTSGPAPAASPGPSASVGPSASGGVVTPSASPTPPTTAGGRGVVVDYRRWLDLVEERALIPASFEDSSVSSTLAQDLLVRFGITSQAQIDQRTVARSAYDALLLGLGELPMPAVVVEAMRAWDFKAAGTAISLTTDVLTALSGPQVGRRHGPRSVRHPTRKRGLGEEVAAAEVGPRGALTAVGDQ